MITIDAKKSPIDLPPMGARVRREELEVLGSGDVLACHPMSARVMPRSIKIKLS